MRQTTSGHAVENYVHFIQIHVIDGPVHINIMHLQSNCSAQQ